MQATCPRCSATYRVSDTNRGRSAKCQKCGERFEIEASPLRAKQSQGASDTQLAELTEQALKRGKLGRFEIRSKLGAGAFGAVYRAYDPVLDREVALKIPHPGALESESQKARYLREPKAAAQLRHPNIVPIFDASLNHENLYIASAFIKGRTLRQFMDDETTNFRTAATIVMKLAQALDYAHAQGIVHRDVKPANIMLDESGEPMLMDFGLASFQEAGSDATVYGKAIGTPAYMPPEQARGELTSIGPASDQYSLGVVLYELITGERPFSGPPDLIISLVQTQEPKAPSKINRQIPRDLETICRKAMAKQPAQRYEQCRALADDLRRWLEDEPIHARRAGHVERLVRWCKREPVVASLIAAVALTLLLGLVGVFAQWRIARHEEQSATRLSEQLQKRQEELIAANAETELQRIEALRQRDQAFHHSYAAKMGLAFVESNKRDYGTEAIALEMRKYLASAAPANHSEELRGWEWNYLNSINAKPLHSFAHRKDGLWKIPSSDGRFVARMARNQIDILDAGTGEKTYTLQTAGSVAAWSNDGTRIVAADADNTQRLKEIDVASGNVVREFDSAPSAVTWVYWSPDQRYIAARSDSKAFVWDASNGTLVCEIATPKQIRTIAWHPQAMLLAISFHVNAREEDLTRVSIYDPITGMEVQSLAGAKDAWHLAWSPDGEYLADCDMNFSPSTTNVWRTSDWKKIAALRGGGHFVCWHPNSRWLATINGAYSNYLKIHVVPELAEYDFQLISNLLSLSWSADGQQLMTIDGEAAQSTRQSISTWNNLHSHSHQYTMRINGSPSAGSFCWSPDGEQMATIAAESTLTIYDVETYEPRTSIELDAHALIWSGWCADGRVFALATDSFVAILDGESAAEVRRFADDGTEITSCMWGPDGHTLATGHVDGRVQMWDADSGKIVAQFAGRGNSIESLAWSAMDQVVFADDRGTLAIQTLGDDTQSVIIEEGLGDIRSLAVDHRFERVAALLLDGQIYIWDLKSRKQLTSWHAHEAGAASIDWSPDGKRLATAGGTATSVRVWDPAIGQELIRFSEGTPIMWARWSPDGRRVAAGSNADRVYIWAAASFAAD